MSRRACAECLGLFDTYDMVEERVEMRGLYKQDRFATAKVRELCKPCAEHVIRWLRGDLPVDQPAMFEEATR